MPSSSGACAGRSSAGARSWASSSDAQRGLQALLQGQGSNPPHGDKVVAKLSTVLERAGRMRTQQRHSRVKLYVLHAPEMDPVSNQARLENQILARTTC